MPLIRVEMLTGRSKDQKRELAHALTAELARIAKCAPESVQIVITDVERSNWAVGGELTDEPAKAR